MKHYLKKLEDQVHNRAFSPALSDFEGASYTYADLAIKMAALHAFFREAGIRKGDKIALVARNSARWAIFFLAANTYEAVIVPILPNFTPSGAMQLIHHSDSVLLITDSDIWKSMDRERLPLLKGVLDAREDRLLWGTPEYRQAWEGRAAAFDKDYPDGLDPMKVEYHSNMDALAIINYTSGTSGDPKGVMLSFGAMSDIVEYCQQHISNQPEAIVSMLPLAHIYGLAMEFIYPCCTGYQICFLGKTPSPSLLMKVMQQVRPSLIITVPMVMEKVYTTWVRPMLNSRSGKLLSSVPGVRMSFYKSIGEKVLSNFGGRVRTIIIGGAPLNWKVEVAFRKISLPYAVGYGMTEACPLLAFEMPKGYVAGSCGKPIHEIRIESSDPERVPGEIQSRGPNITMGYYKNPAADEAAHTEDGWFRTGDLGVMDDAGNIFIRGRIKALILNSSGQNIYPEEVEQVLSTDPIVEESVVLSRDGKIVALVYPHADAVVGTNEEQQNQMAAEIRSRANGQLPKFSQIFYVELVDLPFERTAKGSIKRHLYK
jgi:long-chain acyl-CoA synthetase